MAVIMLTNKNSLNVKRHAINMLLKKFTFALLKATSAATGEKKRKTIEIITVLFC